MKNVISAPRVSGSIARLMGGIGPQIMFSPDENGNATPEEIAAAEKAAADKAAADKAAADKAAADKAAADKAAADEAARLEAEKNMTEAEKEKAKLLREVMDRKAKQKEAEAEKIRLEAELKKFEGVDLEKVKALIEAESTREKQELEAKGEFDRLKKMMADERAAEKKAFEDQIAALRNENKSKDNTIDGLTIGANFSTSNFIREDLVLTPGKARQIYGAHFELKDGEVVAYDKPAGETGRTMLVDASGNALHFEDAMKKIIDADPDKENLLRAKMLPGGGSKTQQFREVPKVPDGDHIKGTSRIAAALEARQKK